MINYNSLQELNCENCGHREICNRKDTAMKIRDDLIDHLYTTDENGDICPRYVAPWLNPIVVICDMFVHRERYLML